MEEANNNSKMEISIKETTYRVNLMAMASTPGQMKIPTPEISSKDLVQVKAPFERQQDRPTKVISKRI
jgi:hypothetical protein